VLAYFLKMLSGIAVPALMVAGGLFCTALVAAVCMRAPILMVPVSLVVALTLIVWPSKPKSRD